VRIFGIRRSKVALFGFVVFLAGLVCLADSGHGRRLFALVQAVPGGDKTGHFLLFGILSFLVNHVLQAAEVRWCWRVLLKGSVLVMAAATLEEFSQLFFRSRTFELLDLACDAVGILAFGWLARRYSARRVTQAQTSARRPG
jgi:VanZ family protein